MVILYSGKRKATNDYGCVGLDACPYLPIRVYENFDKCPHEIFLSEKPAGIAIFPATNNANFYFTNTKDMGAVGEAYSCVDGIWQSTVLH